MKKVLFFITTALLVCGVAHAQKYNELARTPPMGWNSWNHFHNTVNEQDIKDMADAMVATGLRDAGYK